MIFILHVYLRSFMQFLSFVLIGLTVLYSLNIYALPIGFNRNQIDLEYNEIISPNFILYYDKRAPYEAEITIKALESYVPIAHKWFGDRYKSKIPVILSATTSKASFANFITNAIELQTLGYSKKNLPWHEYTHMMHYLHYKNILGPTGTLIHLPWIPSWFLEGLAETMSVSIGSDNQASIERYHTLTNRWPSFDRLHNLYGNGPFSHRGYAVSGSFVRWMLLKTKPGSLKKILEDTYRYTLPWYYVLSANPFSSFMPMDQALINQLGKNAKELYLQYQKEAYEFWHKNKQGPSFVSEKSKRLLFNFIGKTKFQNGSHYTLLRSKNKTKLYKINFDPKTTWMTSLHPTKNYFPKSLTSINKIIVDDNLSIAVLNEKDIKTGLKHHVLSTLRKKDNAFISQNKFYYPAGKITKLMHTKNKIFFFERIFDKTRFCSLPKTIILDKDKITKNHLTCINQKHLPTKTTILDVTNQKISNSEEQTPYAENIWFSHTKEKLTQTTQSIHKWNLIDNSIQEFSLTPKAHILSMVVEENYIYALTREHTRRSIIKIDMEGQCLAKYTPDDFIINIHRANQNELLLTLYEGEKESLKKITVSNLTAKNCKQFSTTTSPIRWSIAQTPKIPDLTTALKHTSIWKQQPLQKTTNKPIKSSSSVIKYKKNKATWRARPVMITPFIGAEDIKSTLQFGFVSIPLMDHMQNETIQLRFLFGPESNYPATEVQLTSTRFWPTLNLSGFKRQTYNGYQIYLEKKNGQEQIKIKTSYLDEVGAYTSMSWPFHFRNLSLGLNFMLSFSQRKRYAGSYRPIEGTLVTPYLGIGASYLITKNLALSNSVSLKIAPKSFNKNYEYHQFYEKLSLVYLWKNLNTKIAIGIIGGLTRGKSGKIPLLKEYYLPLKTHIAGIGGGFNNTNYALTKGGSLFFPRVGDTKFQTFAELNFPLIKDIDKILWLLYLKSLDFSSFITYGSAWNKYYFSTKKLLITHGHNIDLKVENKGVRGRFGIGTGQVIGDDMQLYLRFGFDALF